MILENKQHKQHYYRCNFLPVSFIILLYLSLFAFCTISLRISFSIGRSTNSRTRNRRRTVTVNLFRKSNYWQDSKSSSYYSNMKSENEPVWDAEQGIWLGAKAAAISTEDFPKPLYIFGYGSLIWKPGEGLEDLKAYRCSCLGWKRMFAQRSCDHRGTSKFPGLVLNLVADSLLKQKGMLRQDAPESHCEGVVYLVPEEEKQRVIDILDFREKGGYQRHIIKIQLHHATPFHKAGDVVDSLVYTGSPSNPNFFLPGILDNVVNIEKITTDTTIDAASTFVTIQEDIISAAIGPSGPNVDYLLNLEKFFIECGVHDEYLYDLAHRVRIRLGIWRGRPLFHTFSGITPKAFFIKQTNELRDNVLGWGSNEFLQITQKSYSMPSSDDLLGCKHVAIKASMPIIDSINNFDTLDSQFHLLAGGGSSGYILCDLLVLWGKIVEFLVPRIPSVERSKVELDNAIGEKPMLIAIKGIRNAVLGHEHIIVQLVNGETICLGNNSHGQCDPPACIGIRADEVFLLPQHDETDVDLQYFTICRFVDGKYIPVEGYTKINDIIKISAGVRHSALISEKYGLITWGDGKYGQTLGDSYWNEDINCSSWLPGPTNHFGLPNRKVNLLDVACGNQHTVIVDDDGGVHTIGSNRYGCLGRKIDSLNGERSNFSREIGLVENLPQRIRWQRVSSGWSHIILRGVDHRGSLMFYGWGRNDYSQLPLLDLKCTDANDMNRNDPKFITIPSMLRPLPSDHKDMDMYEVWCGSEFTIAADKSGRLYSQGWNEHGNLGCGKQPNIEGSAKNSWFKVIDEEGNPINLSTVYEGNVACGGAHVISLPSF